MRESLRQFQTNQDNDAVCGYKSDSEPFFRQSLYLIELIAAQHGTPVVFPASFVIPPAVEARLCRNMMSQ
jgi:hypothetical protein